VSSITHIPEDLAPKPKKRKRKHRLDSQLDQEFPTEIAEILIQAENKIQAENDIEKAHNQNQKRRHKKEKSDDAIAED
jgi:hypothetical protein